MKKYFLFSILFSVFLFWCAGVTQAYSSSPNEITPTQKDALQWVKQEFTNFKSTLEKKMHSTSAAENFEAIYQAALKTGLLDPEKLCQKKDYYSAFGRTDSDQLFLRSVHNEILRATSFFRTAYGEPAKWEVSNYPKYNSSYYIPANVSNFNCYGYAIGTNKMVNPGEYSGQQIGIGNSSTLVSIEQIRDCILSDLFTLNYSARIANHSRDVKNGETLIAIRKGVVGFEWGEKIEDYHLVIVNSSKHKPGNTPILTAKFSVSTLGVWPIEYYRHLSTNNRWTRCTNYG